MILQKGVIYFVNSLAKMLHLSYAFLYVFRLKEKTKYIATPNTMYK
jgi:hypothetical protein